MHIRVYAVLDLYMSFFIILWLIHILSAIKSNWNWCNQIRSIRIRSLVISMIKLKCTLEAMVSCLRNSLLMHNRMIFKNHFQIRLWKCNFSYIILCKKRKQDVTGPFWFCGSVTNGNHHFLYRKQMRFWNEAKSAVKKQMQMMYITERQQWTVLFICNAKITSFKNRISLR